MLVKFINKKLPRTKKLKQSIVLVSKNLIFSKLTNKYIKTTKFMKCYYTVLYLKFCDGEIINSKINPNQQTVDNIGESS